MVMLGRQRLKYHSHGVECTLESLQRQPDGTADVVLVAGRLCEVVGVGDDEGSRWFGRSGSVRWVTPDSDERQVSCALLASAEALGRLSTKWLSLVKAGGRERSPGQLDDILRDLGTIPPATSPAARALWIAALINPLPALGVLHSKLESALGAHICLSVCLSSWLTGLPSVSFTWSREDRCDCLADLLNDRLTDGLTA